jgi:predicted transcriptional regulator
VELTDQEKSLLALLSHDQSSSLQDIANQWWWDIQDLMCHLTTLEIKNIIYQEYPGRYRLS